MNHLGQRINAPPCVWCEYSSLCKPATAEVTGCYLEGCWPGGWDDSLCDLEKPESPALSGSKRTRIVSWKRPDLQSMCTRENSESAPGETDRRVREETDGNWNLFEPFAGSMDPERGELCLLSPCRLGKISRSLLWGGRQVSAGLD